MSHIADPETLLQRRLLAASVRDALAAAGLPLAAQDLSYYYGLGAEVEVDEGNDSGGGVWVSWHPHPHLRKTAVELVAKHHHAAAHNPIVKHAGAVSQAMYDAMRAILVSAGYKVRDCDDDVRVYALRVVLAPAKALLPTPVP